MKLDPQEHDWLSSKPAKRVFKALPADSARFVGGCVRNAILGQAVADLDIATTQTPDQVSRALKSAGIAVHETGLSHGTVTAVADHIVFEITTLREDVTTDGRRASVNFTTDWARDAQRRDFTMNALYAAPDGTVFDPCGQGIADAKAQRIRFVGPAEDRIREDYLRILRFFRFHAWYAPEKAMDKDALTACRELQAGLKELSAERVWAEMKKLLLAPSPERTVNAMGLNGILETLLPEASNSEGLQLILAVEAEAGLSPDPYLRLMAMAARDELAMARLCSRLKMSNAEKTRLMRWAGDRAALSPGLSGAPLFIECYKSGKQAVMDRAIIRAAGASDPVVQAGWLSVFRATRDWQRPEFPLRGADILAAGHKPGKSVGKTLAALEALWIKSGFSVSREKLLMAMALLQR